MLWGALWSLNLPISAVSWERGVYSDDLKIPKVTPIYKAAIIVI